VADDTPQYVIFVGEGGEGEMHVAPLANGDADYFRRGIVANLRPLSDDEYANGPAVFLHTLAKSSYVLYQNSVYWCTEWEPGLIVVRFSPDGPMAWVALRSPVPNFGGREPLPEDLGDYDEDANPQYNLIFTPWDALFDDERRADDGFARADAQTVGVYESAFTRVSAIGEQLRMRYSDEAGLAQWAVQCKQNLTRWASTGIRVSL
jgi:hypothetical protein